MIKNIGIKKHSKHSQRNFQIETTRYWMQNEACENSFAKYRENSIYLGNLMEYHKNNIKHLLSFWNRLYWVCVAYIIIFTMNFVWKIDCRVWKINISFCIQHQFFISFPYFPLLLLLVSFWFCQNYINFGWFFFCFDIKAPNSLCYWVGTSKRLYNTLLTLANILFEQIEPLDQNAKIQANWQDANTQASWQDKKS